HIVVDGPYDAIHTHMRPYDRRAWMTPEQRFHLVQVSRRLVQAGRRHIDVVVYQDKQAGFFSEIENAVHGRIEKTRDTTRNFAGNEFFVNRELADAGEDTGKGPQHAANVIRGVRVRWIKTRDHRIEARLFFSREGQVS